MSPTDERAYRVLENLVDDERGASPGRLADPSASRYREEMVEWLRERPEVLYPLIERFPPACVVRGRRSLLCPPSGRTGVVYSYFEPTEEVPDGSISVICEDVPFRGICAPDWLEVVSYADSPIGPIDSAKVAELIEYVRNTRNVPPLESREKKA